MIYLYLFGTCFHFIYVFMIIWKVILKKQTYKVLAAYSYIKTKPS